MTETKQAAGGRTVHLALVQFESVLCDPAANTQKACRMIAEAAAEGADLVVLPELFSTGYELNIVGPHVPELAEPVDGPTVRALQDAARAGNCYVVAGLALAYDMAGVPFNSSVVIDRRGASGHVRQAASVGARALLLPLRLRLPGVRHRLRAHRRDDLLRHGLPRGRAHAGAAGG